MSVSEEDRLARLRQSGRRRQPQRRAHGGLLAGLPVEVAGITVNRLCASGMDAVGLAARSIKAGEAD
jgi:acetyl-CoA acetyltransferase